MTSSRRSAAVVVLAAWSAACGASARLQPRAGVFWSKQQAITVASVDVKLTLANPVSPDPPPFVVVFASGDGGLSGISLAILQHLAESGYRAAGFSSPEAFGDVVSRSDTHPNYVKARDAFEAIVLEAKHALEVPDDMPIVLTGMSRGASVVVAAGGDPKLQKNIIGAVAIALTREFDELTVPDSAKSRPGVETDEEGRLQTYPAIARLGAIPLAIIQSTKDGYVKSAESRTLLGPDTPTRRLYEVPSKGHSFGGGEDKLMRDLDDAMRWIAQHADTARH